MDKHTRLLITGAGGLLGGALAKQSVGRRSGEGMQEAVQKHRKQLEKYEDLCRKIGESPAVVGLAWLLSNPIVTAPIIGPRTLGHLEDALGILDKNLAEVDIPLFDALVHPGNAVADFHNSNDWMKARI